MRLRPFAGLALLFLTGCFELHGCDIDLDGCDNDFECGAHEICVTDDSFGARCELRTFCSEGCAGNETCEQRPGLAADNPFTSDTPGKQVCQCTFNCDGGFGGEGGAIIDVGGQGGGPIGGAGGAGGAPECDLPAPVGSVNSVYPVGTAGPESGPLLAQDDPAFALSFEGSLTLLGQVMTSNGGPDVLIVNESFDWVRQIGNADANVPSAIGYLGFATGVATSFKGTLDIGAMDGEIDAGPGTAAVVVGLNTMGDTDWQHVLRSDGDVTISGLAYSKSSNLVMFAGTFSGELDLGGISIKSGDGADGFVVTIEPVSHQVQGWHVLGGAGDQHISALAADDIGNLYLVGRFEGELSLDGGPGYTSDAQDGFFARLPGDATEPYFFAFGGPDSQEASAIALSPDGSLVIAGTRSSTSASAGYVQFGESAFNLAGIGLVDSFVTRMDPDSYVHWAQLLPGAAGTGEVAARGLSVDCQRNILIAGGAAGDISFGTGPITALGKRDAFVHKMDENGNPLWTKLAGGAEDDEASAVRADGSVIRVSGSFTGSAGFDDLALESQGAEDAFVLEVAP